MLWSRPEEFKVQKYPAVQYGFYRVLKVDGTPSGDLAGLDTGCAIRLDALDSTRSLYKLSVIGTVSKNMTFRNVSKKGGVNPQSLVYVNDQTKASVNLAIKYGTNVLTFAPAGAPLFSVKLE